MCWHTPNDTAVAVVSPHLESRWSWTKWLPHTESQDIDGAGPARYLGASLRDVETMLEPLLKERAKLVDERGAVDVSAVSKAHSMLCSSSTTPTLPPLWFGGSRPAMVSRSSPIAIPPAPTVITVRRTSASCCCSWTESTVEAPR